MFNAMVFRGVGRAVIRAPALRSSPRTVARTAPVTALRPFSISSAVRDEESKNEHGEYEKMLTRSKAKSGGDHEGSFSRTDKSIQVEYPEEADYPAGRPVQGRGGYHFRRTLASFSLEDRTAIVTGGARGLGLVMSQACVVSGANVAIVDLNKDEGERQAESIVQTFIEENPGAQEVPKVTAHYCDVSDPESVKSTMAEILEAHGKVDDLVTSAGFTENFDAIQYPIDRVRKLWSVNVDGTYLWSCEVAKHLMDRKAHGAIVMIGSMSGAVVNVPQPQAPYNAAKAAVRHLASSFAVEWAHAGIRVNVISPGYMLTALTKKILDENPDLHRKWVSLIPQGKMGRPEDLMGAVTFLLSDAAEYITGADLRVDGGYTIT
ncbi:MAG: hypothetical protein M1820_008980 [Bogoriella megaspora]|nr:MAG: hypothetical protein M1820_008980 [Bogoriella megaspora]